MSTLTINGVAVAVPKSFSVAVTDVDGKSTRNSNGDMIRDRITVKRKLECEWPPLTQEEISTLLNAVSSVFFSVSYPDPVTGQTTKEFYVGDRTAPAYSFNDKFRPWNGLTMNFIER